MGRGLPAASGGKKLKSSWPEVVGKYLAKAGAIIKAQRQDVDLQLFGAADPQPPDFNPHRVCLFLDGNLIVIRTPVVG